MTDVVPLDQLNISLEPHLVDTLRLIFPIASPELVSTLSPYLSSDPPSTIPYVVLRALSHWTRTTGYDALCNHSPPLDLQAYTMIALLAGTTTSPERKFGAFTPARDPAELQTEKNQEKKMITALLNALLSVLGSGFAAWWAADKTGWGNEWRVLFGLFVAILVAVAEAALWLIWQSRRSDSVSKRVKPRRRLPSARYKKDDGPDMLDATTGIVEVTDVGLRRRH